MADELKSARWKKLCARLRQTLPPVCWICGKPIDLLLSGRDPRGFSLDHVVPRSIDPSLTFVESNLRPAHMGCNAKRGNTAQIVNSSRKWS